MDKFQALAAEYRMIYGARALNSAVKDFIEGSLTWKEVLGILSND